MVAGTRRGVVLLGTHSLLVQALHALFASLFTEYYVHGFLLVLRQRKPRKHGAAAPHDEYRVQVSKVGLWLLVAAQLVYAIGLLLHHAGITLSAPLPGRLRRVRSLPPLLSNETRFALLLGLAWWLLHLPLLPSTVTFTLVTAAEVALAARCAAVAGTAAVEMILQRPKEERLVRATSRIASAGAAAVVFAASFLYDGSVPRHGAVDGFHVGVFVMSVAAACIFAVLQRLRRGGGGGAHGEDAVPVSRDEAASGQRCFVGLIGPSTREYHGFVQQTCQRRSMKALLAVRAVHAYAQTAMLAFFHLLLTRGTGPHLSAASRALLLACAVAAPALLVPAHAAAVSVAGKKRTATAAMVLTGVVALVSLVAAFCARSTGAAAAAEPTSAGAAWLCAVLLLLQRVLLDSVGELLELAQEDVVEEDAILFGRASPLAAWTRRLCATATAPMAPLSCIGTAMLLAVTHALDVVVPAAALRGEDTIVTSTAAAVAAGGAAVVDVSTRAVAALGLPEHTAAALSSAVPTQYAFHASGVPVVLALTGVQTLGAALVMGAVWHRFYNLEGKHLQFVQMATRKRRDEQAVTLV